MLTAHNCFLYLHKQVRAYVSGLLTLKTLEVMNLNPSIPILCFQHISMWGTIFIYFMTLAPYLPVGLVSTLLGPEIVTASLTQIFRVGKGGYVCSHLEE